MIFDYIVVGAGAAGCVLANRLSADARNQVLLVEAGRDLPPGREPRIVRDTYPRSYAETTFMWPELMVEMKERGPDAQTPAPRRYEQGRVMGGGGTIMGMFAFRGLPGDYDEWADLGASGWDWNGVLPYFRKLERDLDYGGPLHGSDGPVPIRRHAPGQWPPFCAAVGRTLSAFGYAGLDDMNAEFGDGCGALPMSSLPTHRVSSAVAYLDTAARRRPNLRIMTETTVERLITEGRRVVGIVARSGQNTTQFRAAETVVAAGSLHSPALLLRAGIGPAESLRRLGLTPISDRRGVGRNLQNHPIIYLAADLKREALQPNSLRPMTYNCLRFSSGVPDCAASDMFMPIFNRTSWHAAGGRTAALAVAVYKAYSRGEVTLRSADPAHEPQVRFNLASDKRDRVRLAQGLRLAWRIMHAPGVAPLVNAIYVPAAPDVIRNLNRPNAANWLKGHAIAALLKDSRARRALINYVGRSPEDVIDDSEALEDFVYAHTGAMFHPVGTCRMGAADDIDAVVDARCRVLGVDGLRVVDGSVMPTIVRANTNLPIIMIAERAADLMLEDAMRPARSSGLADPIQATRAPAA